MEPGCRCSGAKPSQGWGCGWTAHHFQQRRVVRSARLCQKQQALQTASGLENRTRMHCSGLCKPYQALPLTARAALVFMLRHGDRLAACALIFQLWLLSTLNDGALGPGGQR